MTKLAAEITAIDPELADLDSQVTERFNRHESAEVLLSLPGTGSLLSPAWRRSHGPPDGSAATFIGPADSIADYSEPAASLHLSSLKNSPASRAFYDR